MSLVKLGKRRRSLMLSNIAHKFAECLHPVPDILLEDEPKLVLKVLHDVIDAIFVNRRQHMKSVIWHETAGNPRQTLKSSRQYPAMRRSSPSGQSSLYSMSGRCLSWARRDFLNSEFPPSHDFAHFRRNAEGRSAQSSLSGSIVAITGLLMVYPSLQQSSDCPSVPYKKSGMEKLNE